MANNIESYDVNFKESVERFLKGENFQKILNFYLWDGPIKGSSTKGNDFAFYGIEKQTVINLKTQMLEKATLSLRDNFEPCARVCDVESKLENMNSVIPPNEFCVFLAGSESVRKIFTHIRNAFAHGWFHIIQYSDVRIYIFENNYQKRKAKMALRESTLLGWIDCVRGFNKPKQGQETAEKETVSEIVG